MNLDRFFSCGASLIFLELIQVDAAGVNMGVVLILQNNDCVSGLMGRLNDISREVRLLAVVTSHHVLDHWTRLGCIQAKHVQEFTRLLRILIKEEDKSIREAVEGNSMNLIFQESFIN